MEQRLDLQYDLAITITLFVGETVVSFLLQSFLYSLCILVSAWFCFLLVEEEYAMLQLWTGLCFDAKSHEETQFYTEIATEIQPHACESNQSNLDKKKMNKCDFPTRQNRNTCIYSHKLPLRAFDILVMCVALHTNSSLILPGSVIIWNEYKKM